MKCPQCQTEVVEWHFYCPNCRALLQPFAPIEKPRRGVVERVARGLMSWLLIIGFVAGSVLVARAINWKELIGLLRQQPAAVEETKTAPRPKRGAQPTRKNSQGREDKRGLPESPSDSSTAESVREISSQVDELPPPDVSAPEPNSRTGQTSTQNPPVTPRPPSKTPESPVVKIEQSEMPPTEQTGLVTINCYVPARVYIDGQYSGVTPRTVQLLVGDHQIRLVADGYEEWSRRIRVRNRQQVGVIASLTKASP